MNVTLEEISAIKRKLTVELPEEEVRRTRKKLLDDYARKARLKGFRPGKAPRDMVARAYADELKLGVTEEVVARAVPEALKERGLNPVGHPVLENVDYQDGLPLKFSVLVELKPAFDSPAWRGLTLQRRKSRVNDELVAKKLEELRLSLATVKTVTDDRPLVMGDLVTVSYRAFNEAGAELPKYGGGPFNLDLVKSRQLAPGFLEGLLGMKAGETKEIFIRLPEDAADRQMAGQPLKLLTTVGELKSRELPDLDDEFAKDLGLEGVETLADLRERLRRDLLKEETARDDRLFNQQMTKLLADMVDIEAPSSMVEREVENRLRAMRDGFTRNGLDFKKARLDADKMREGLRPLAAKSVAAALVLDQIGRENQVDISEEEIEAELIQMSAEYGQTLEAVRGYYQAHGLLETMREGLKISKTLDMIKAQAVIEEVERLDPDRFGLDLPGENRPAVVGAALSGAGEDASGEGGAPAAAAEAGEGAGA